MAHGSFNGPAARVIRERSEMSIAELVEKVREEGIDVHPDHIRNIELGYKQPSPKLAGAMARALAVQKHVLLVVDTPFHPRGSGGPRSPGKTAAASRDGQGNGDKPTADERKAS